MDITTLRDRYDAAAQGHVFQFWPQLSDLERIALVHQLEALDIERVNRIFSKAVSSENAAVNPDAQAKVIQQVRDAAWKIEMNARRIETARAARDLAEQRLDAEQKRFEVGMSTSFLVIQAQRDFAQAKTNALGAVLAYDLALVDFEALQQAGPAAK